MPKIVRTPQGWGLFRTDEVRALRHPLAEILAGAPVEESGERLEAELLAPVDRQEVWAAGVTYERSLTARKEESEEPDSYDRVYDADRPELFFKSAPERVVHPGGVALIRSDSTWDVPEPEVALVLDSSGRIFGYTIGDDVSSRSIEGENPLYLPQAKVYEGSCVLGPWILPAAEATPPFAITMRVHRDGEAIWAGSVSTAKMRRGFEDLAGWLARGLRFPHGAVLMTGTGIVPPSEFTLRPGDRVEIDVEGIGVLEHGIAEWPC